MRILKKCKKEEIKMDDYFEDYDDGFDGDDFGDDGHEFMDDDSIEDALDDDFGSEDSLDDDSGIEDEPTGDDICEDEFTANEAAMFEVAMGFAYEEGLEEGKRRKLQRELDKDDDDSHL